MAKKKHNCRVTAIHERSTRRHSSKFRVLHKILVGSRNHHKTESRKTVQHERFRSPADIKHDGHLFRAISRLEKSSRNINGLPKAVIVKVNGQNVYSSDNSAKTSTGQPTPSQIPKPSQPPPQTQNINLHINLTKSPNPPEKEPNRPIVISAPPQPQPQPVVAVVPQPAQPAQPQLVPQVLPAVVPPVATSTSGKKGESSLNKILLTAALLKGLSGSDSSGGNSRASPSVLSNLITANPSPLNPLLSGNIGLSLNSPLGSVLGYPQAGASQTLGYPVNMGLLGGLNLANARLGKLNVGFPAVGQNMGYPLFGSQNMGYPAGGNLNLGYPATGNANTGFLGWRNRNLGYPARGNQNMGYPAVGNQNMGYPAGVNQNMGYPAVGNQNMGYPAGVIQNMGYPAVGNQNMGYPAGVNQNIGYPAVGNQNIGYPAGGNQNMGYPAGGNQNMGYPAGGNQYLGYPAVGNQNMGYPAGGNQNMAYPGGGGGGGGGGDNLNMEVPTIPNFLSGLAPTPPTNTGQNAGAPLGGNTAPIPGQAPGAIPSPAPVVNPGPVAGTNAGQGPGVGAVVPPGTVVPETSPTSPCWCGCEADCSHPCDLCNANPTNIYSPTPNSNTNANITGSLQAVSSG